MTDKEQRQSAKKFSEYWKGRGYEKGESQPFWLSLLREVFGVEEPEKFISFEDRVFLDHTSFIDGYIKDSKVLIEQKGLNKDLRAPIKQSDGSYLTPFQQAKRYVTELPVSQHPRWIVTCNFEEFNIYDMEQPMGKPEILLLKNLDKEYYRLQFLVDVKSDSIQKEMDISFQAGDLVGILYDEILEQYKDKESEETLKSLNELCVRLVFCLYAEDSGVFGKRNMFHDYLKKVADKDIDDVRDALVSLFKVLDTKVEDRDPYLKEDLAQFPYVNGGLFANEDIIVPRFNEKIVDILLNKASLDFDWSNISPTIFGAVFESTLNQETRRKGGMHYTSIENIHKVIDPLFLDDLKEELQSILELKVLKTKMAKLDAFQDKLSKLKFLDPACGSGNFLTETYISLRRLENEVIMQKVALDRQQVTGQIQMGYAGLNPIKVSISQFYGIEVNDFAVTVGKTALWIAESQMMKETEEIIHMSLDFLPLKTNAYITEGNALRLDWGDIVPVSELSYIMGNPPFVGIRHSDEKTHRNDLKQVVSVIKNSGVLDYVTGWYIKATELMTQNVDIETAFVSTNSIVQGEQACRLWKYIIDEKNMKINFAYQTFKWSSEAREKAVVHCVIVAFSRKKAKVCKLYSANKMLTKCDNINEYLLPMNNLWLSKRRNPICDVPIMQKGCYPTDGGNYIFTKEQMIEFIGKEPKSEKYFRRWIGSEDMINRKERYILFLKDCPPEEINKMPFVKERVKNVIETRSKSTKEGTRKKAYTPLVLDEERIPTTEFLVMPVVSSSNRRYIPIDYKTPPDICYASCFFVENADLYLFGILMSNVHNAWMRLVCGRWKSDYRYSNTLAYNNFPMCNPTDEQRKEIEKTAQHILDARAMYPNSTLADLYNDVTMPAELRKAHLLNDRAVMLAYGFSIKDTTEESCVAELMKMYQNLTDK